MTTSTIKHRGKIVDLESPFSPNHVLEIITPIIQSSRKFKQMRSINGDLVYSTGNLGIWGSFLFHFSLLITLIALLINFAWGHKLMFSLTEGETFDNQIQDWQHSNSGWFVESKDLDSFSLSLSSFIPPVLSNGQMIKEGTATVFSRNGQTPQTINYGKGSQIDSHSLILTNWGFSPGLIINDITGNELLNGYIRLTSRWVNDGRLHSDYYELTDGTSLNLSVSDQEVLNINIEHVADDEASSSTLSLHLGRSGSIRGFQIAYPELRTWNQFELQSNPGQFLLYFGLMTSIAGLMMRILFTRRSLLISINELKHYTSITISSSSEKYRASYTSDIQNLISELEPLLNPLLTINPNWERVQAKQKELDHANI